MLTPEQIKSFEARAEAGERPVMEWEPRPIHRPFFDCWNSWACLDRYVYEVGSKRDDMPHRFMVSDHSGRENYGEFTSLPAAQLAAEHLLREATAPLWQEAIDRRIRAAMAAQREEAKPE
jgi:hypothetical protein